MATLKNRLLQLEALAAPKLAKQMQFFRHDGTPEQAEEIAELHRQGIRTLTFTRAEEQTIE